MKVKVDPIKVMNGDKMTDHMDYQNFVRGKIAMAKFSGFDVSDSDISPILKALTSATS